jgi:hypothetical protein
MRLRTLAAVLFLAAQLGAVVYSRFTPRRYFCWTPNDMREEYQLQVEVNGRVLPQAEAWSRYGIEKRHQGAVEHPIEHLMDDIAQYETTYGRGNQARVWLRWRHNGAPTWRDWQWPR